MSEKITIQNIIELLTKKHGMARKDAETFVKGMFELIEETLATEKYVKVKGFGTFKLTEVESRESVNVHTGERFEIQGHTKISFTPDPGMRELINKPFAHFETVVLNENTRLEDMETDPEEEEGEDRAERTADTRREEDAAAEDTPPVAESPAPEEESPAPEEESPATEEEPAAPASLATEEKEKNPKLRWRIAAAVVVALCLVACAYRYLLPSQTHAPQVPATENTSRPQPEEALPAATPADTVHHPNDTLSADTVSVPAPVRRAEAANVPAAAAHPDAAKTTLTDTVEYDITGTKTLYTLQEGESLVRLAARFYGTKKLWPYIVKHNKDLIKDADKVPIGTTLRIPELTPKK